jgi:NADH-quinone oxidoreductase subunit G
MTTAEIVDMITVVIDGFEVSVPKGTLVIRAAEQLGIQIPRFCDHPLLDPVGACRQCLVDIEINGRAFPKPPASCTIPVEPGMIVKTQLTSPVADKAQQGVMELLLINHPLDCPVCDKGGECELQDMTFRYGLDHSRFTEEKLHYPEEKWSPLVYYDAPRCIMCFRCVRVCDEVEGAHTWDLRGRGVDAKVIIDLDEPWGTSQTCTNCGKCVNVCPTGALSRKGTGVAEMEKRSQFLSYLTLMRGSHTNE